MSDPTTVYAVSRGEYSGYSVVCLFTDRGSAEAFVREHNDTARHYDEMNPVEELLLYDGTTPKRRTYYSMAAVVNDDGRASSPTTAWSESVWDFEKPVDFHGPHGKPSVRVWRGYDTPYVEVSVTGFDEQAVKQSLSDMVARIVYDIQVEGIVPDVKRYV